MTFVGAGVSKRVERCGQSVIGKTKCLSLSENGEGNFREALKRLKVAFPEMRYDLRMETCHEMDWTRGRKVDGKYLFIKMLELQELAPLKDAENAMLKCINAGVIDLDMKYVTAGLTPTHFDNYMMLPNRRAAAPIDLHPTTTLLLNLPLQKDAAEILEMIKKCNKIKEALECFKEVKSSGCMDDFNLNLLEQYVISVSKEDEGEEDEGEEDEGARPPPMLWGRRKV